MGQLLMPELTYQDISSIPFEAHQSAARDGTRRLVLLGELIVLLDAAGRAWHTRPLDVG
jgi:hypothetical protein